jgi:hypothetical protein
MSGRWWRAYEESLDDPKVQLLDPPVFKAWFNLLCLTSANGGVLPPMPHIAFKLRVPVLQAELVLSVLIEADLFEKREDGTIAPHNWNGRQYRSDVSTLRVKRFRKRKRNVSPTVSETPPETETETETETEADTERKQASKVVALARGERLAADWYPNDVDLKFAADLGLRLFEVDNETSKFSDYWHARAGPGAVKRDWSATWRNWCRKAIEDKGKGNGTGRKQTLVERGQELARRARELENSEALRRKDEPIRSD